MLFSRTPSKYNARGGPDIVSEEIATVLMGKGSLEFKALFTLVFTNLRARNLGGGEEMLRLRVYEKLQTMIKKGMVDKVVTNGVREYLGLAGLSAALPAAPLAQAA